MKDQFRLLEAMVNLSQRFYFRVTSCYRNHKINKMVGGAKYSLHLNWTAIDIQLMDEKDLPHFLEAVEKYRLHAKVEKDHIHIQV